MIRHYTFKVEAIQEVKKLDQLIESKRLVKEENLKRAIYDVETREAQRDEQRCLARTMNRAEYAWHFYSWPALSIFLATVFLILSLTILLSEVTLFLDFVTFNAIYNAWETYTTNNPSESFFVSNILCLIPLVYMSCASFFGLF